VEMEHWQTGVWVFSLLHKILARIDLTEKAVIACVQEYMVSIHYGKG